MEGSWRDSRPRLVAVLAGLALIVCAAAASGCGDGESESAASTGALTTPEPLRTFAPLVLVPRDEEHRPVSARWFLERSMLAFADRPECDARPIAVGRTMPELQNDVVDWL
ncbi:MAG: hypothetical protein GXY03_10925, partial [Solirubrobacterales bacterium]|nr:hypothetical protein [Solirubrobacterales bacterium]